MKKGDLIWWISPSKTKFYGIITHITKTKVYMVSDSSGHDAPIEMVKPTTVEAVIRYNRKKWGHSAKRTRGCIEQARHLVKR